MATINSGLASLTDVLAEIAPDGSQLDTAEILKQTNPVLDDQVWVEGNLVTGHRDAVRTALPTPSFRAINEGVPVTKGATTQIEEACALLEDFSQCDRELAMLSGNVERFRLKQAKPHIQGMSHLQATTLFYGNAITGDTRSYTGLAPRYNTLLTANSATARNVIGCGGTGSALRSMWLVGWSEDTVFGLYPKGTMAGLSHEDATNASNSGGDGVPGATVLTDANGGLYMGFRDHWTWRCGLMVKDWRYAVRAANIDPSLLTKNQATGIDIQDVMAQMSETIESLDGVKAAFYVPRVIMAMLRRQLLSSKNQFLNWDMVGGKKVLMFGEIPIRRTDALNVNEAQVV